MAKEWMSLAHASSILGISVKALHVRIEELGYETRVKNGKRYVAIDLTAKDLADPQRDNANSNAVAKANASVTSPALAKLAETRASKAIKQMTHHHAKQIQIAEHAVAGWQKAAIQAKTAQEERARELRRTRTRATLAVSAASFSIITVVLVGLWATHSLTASEAAVTITENQLSATKAQSQTLEQSLGDSRETLAITRYQLLDTQETLKQAQAQSFKASVEAAAAKREAEVLREELEKQRALLRGR